MEENKDYGLENIHKVLLDDLLELDRICRNNGINYSLHGGTLLGAVRNHHFIPWDDDADVSMTRENFERFQIALASNDDFNVEVLLWTPRFFRKEGEPRICVDIFIWDYISEKKIFQQLKLLLLRFLQGTIKDRNYFMMTIKTHGIVGKVLLAFTYILGLPFTKKFKLRVYNYISQKVLVGKKKYIHRSNDSFKSIEDIFDKAYMNDYTDLILENEMFMAATRYEEFLIKNYGDDYLIPQRKKGK